MVALIPFYKPTLRRKDMDAVLQTMVDERIGPGQRKNEFLKQFCTLVGTKGGMALRSYVDALSSALELCDVCEGTKIGASVLSPAIYQYVVKKLGAQLVLGDIDIEHGCLSQSEAERLVGEGCTVLLIHEPMCQIPVGNDYRQLGITVIEDISQSISSEYEDLKAGSFGDLVVCSFEEDGVVSCGGGAVLAYAKETYKSALKDLYGARIEFEELPDMNAALGIIQLVGLSEQVSKRREFFSLFSKSLMKTQHKLFGIGNIDFLPNGFGFSVILDSKPEEAIAFATKYQVSAKKTFSDCLGANEKNLFERFPKATAPLLRTISLPLYPFLKQAELELLMKVISHLP